MKVLKWIVAGICSFCIIGSILFTAVDLASVGDKQFYRQQYSQNGTYEFIDISEYNLMRVTDVLLNYMTGHRTTLDMKIDYNGSVKEFFDDTEKIHMQDVRNLYVGGIKLRRFLIMLAGVCLVGLKALNASIRKTLPRAYVACTVIFGAVSAFLGIYISCDFTNAFVKFYEILFDNNMWILDSKTSKLIHMVPQQFFINLAERIGFYFVSAAFIVAVLAAIEIYRDKKAQGD